MPTTDRLKGDRELKTLDTVSWDDEGFLVCKVHGQRMSGWRSPSHSPTLPMGIAQLTDLEWQAWVLYGDKPAKELDIGTEIIYSTQDLRDNRDPEKDFDYIMQEVIADRAKHLSKRTLANGNGNGHHAFSSKEIAAVQFRGNEQMRYQRELATAQVISTDSKELAKRETGF